MHYFLRKRKRQWKSLDNDFSFLELTFTATGEGHRGIAVVKFSLSSVKCQQLQQSLTHEPATAGSTSGAFGWIEGCSIYTWCFGV